VATADGMLEFVKAIKHDWFGVNLDTGNFASDDPYAEIEKCASYAVTCQLKMAMKDSKKKEIPVDFARIVKILRKANYRGFLTLEYEKNDDAMVGIPKALAQLRKVTG
jgi:sugar phosphate isomerase/epimerase